MNNDLVIQAKREYISMMSNATGLVADEKRKNFNSWQKRSKGYQFTATASNSNIGNLDLSGTAKMFLGLNFKNAQAGDTFTFTLNEEIIHQDVNAQMFDSSVVNCATEFFESLRFLSGKDTLKVTYKGAAGQNVEINFYYI